MTAMLATQLNHLVVEGILAPWMTLKMKEYVCNKVQGKQIIILLKVEVVSMLATQIGNPVHIDDASSHAAAPAQPSVGSAVRPPAQQYQQSAESWSADDLSRQPILAINTLNPYQNRWTIKARVTNKSELRRYQNTRGDGKLFNADLIDEAGTEIRMTFFNEQADSFGPILQVGSVYYISRGSLKPANKRFSNIKNDYELTAGNDTIIQPASSGNDIPLARPPSYVMIDTLPDRNLDDIVDVIGVIHQTGDAQTFNGKKGEFTKRAIVIADESMRSVELTVWGDAAVAWNAPQNAILSVKGAKVGDYNGRNLSALRSSTVEVNPDLRRTIDLRSWYDSNPNHVLIPLSQGGSGTRSGREDQQMSFVAADALVSGEKPAWFWVNRAWTTKFRNGENTTTYYERCATPDCKKKVTESGGSWHCDTCHQNHPNSVPTYALQLTAADHTSSLRLSALGDPGIALMQGKEARLVKEAQGNLAEYERIFDDVSFKLFNFKIRSKAESYQGTESIKHSVLSATPVNWVTDGRSVAGNIRQLLGQ